MNAYTKQVRYIFECGGQSWALTSCGDDQLQFEETRKNGQEDCHVYGSAELIAGSWKILDKWDRQQIEEMWGEWMVNELERYFNEHAPPTEFSC